MRALKYSFLAIFIILVSPTTFLYAQNGVQAIVDIKAEVIQSIELITVKSMTIRQLQPGQTEVYVDPVTNADAGHMIAVGTPEADIRINYIKTRELTRIDGEGVLIFNYEVTGNQEDNQQTSELLGDDNRILRFNQEGEFFIWVGGNVNLERATPGSYEGDFTIEIEYI